jgi:hypothetical protein
MKSWHSSICISIKLIILCEIHLSLVAFLCQKPLYSLPNRGKSLANSKMVSKFDLEVFSKLIMKREKKSEKGEKAGGNQSGPNRLPARGPPGALPRRGTPAASFPADTWAPPIKLSPSH